MQDGAAGRRCRDEQSSQQEPARIGGHARCVPVGRAVPCLAILSILLHGHAPRALMRGMRAGMRGTPGAAPLPGVAPPRQVWRPHGARSRQVGAQRDKGRLRRDRLHAYARGVRGKRRGTRGPRFKRAAPLVASKGRPRWSRPLSHPRHLPPFTLLTHASRRTHGRDAGRHTHTWV